MSWLRVLGKFLISVGVGFLLFVAWTLWGTGLYTAQQQDRLREELSRLPEIEPEEKTSKDGREFVGPGESFDPDLGEPVFALSIPAIDVSDVVVQGVGEEELKLGPGHYPDCAPGVPEGLCTDFEEVWPGEAGPVIVSGHRTTYSEPFGELDKLRAGDEIVTDTRWGEFTYKVRDIEIRPAPVKLSEILSPRLASSGAQQPEAEMILTTCNPKFSAAERLIVYAELEDVT
ncbi:MAG: sortase [Actinomycetota bacterium]|nr:sortase [Actinomycetota bacterium]